MKKEIAEQLSAALRSGAYVQGHRSLKDNRGGHRCLGVLCDLSVKAGKAKWDGMYCEGPSGARARGALPSDVMEWSGMRDTAGRYSEEFSLASDNDSGKTFAQIADTIDAFWEQL
jgi:hypothetical protein